MNHFSGDTTFTGATQPAKSPLKQIVPWIAIIVLLTAALRMPLLNIPFERDEGEYAYIAWRLGYHELPYRDWFDHKPPCIYWVYRLALNLPFDPIRSVHFMGLLFSAASACALFFWPVGLCSRRGRRLQPSCSPFSPSIHMCTE